VAEDELFRAQQNARPVKNPDGLREPCLECDSGVVYRPETERLSHYFSASLARQFDVVVHFDQTRAIEPLERTAGWQRSDAPETYPAAV
jgi:erythromycin esterase-like protein